MAECDHKELLDSPALSAPGYRESIYYLCDVCEVGLHIEWSAFARLEQTLPKPNFEAMTKREILAAIGVWFRSPDRT